MEFFPHNPFADPLFYDKIPSTLRRKITKAYREPSRKYHNQWHLTKIWSLYLAMFRDDEQIKQKIFYTTIFHDLVYVPGAKDNEEKSAEIFMKFSDGIFSNPNREEIELVILATKDHTNPNHDSLPEWGKIFLDLDLYELASFPEIYRQNSELIRQEFLPFITPEEFEEGRQKFLKLMLDSPKIFRIFPLRDKYARINLRTEIKT